MSKASPVIAFILHQMHVAGAEVLSANLARCLRSQFQFVFFCLDAVGPLGQQLAKEGFEVIDLGRRPGIDWSVSLRLRQQMRRRAVALLHAHQYTPFFYAAVARWIGPGPPILFTEHGRHYPDVRKTRRVLANKLLLRGKDRVTAVGQFVKRALADNEGMADGRIEVIHNGIDPAQFDLDLAADRRTEIRSQLGLTDAHSMVLQVARFHPVKDHETSIRAFSHTVRKVPEAVLVLVGEGERRATIETLAKQMGLNDRVRFLGLRQDVPALMNAADVFTLSSVSEGISVTLLEAMAARLPTAATDVGGNSEIIVHGQTGLLSPRANAKALGANLTALLRTPTLRQGMGTKGHTRLLERFTQQRMHEAYTRLYEQML